LKQVTIRLVKIIINNAYLHLFNIKELGIMPEISESVNALGWLLPTDIQSDAIPLILGGGDVLMAAETGN
jgi:superfamily II DNA/RNA helicase